LLLLFLEFYLLQNRFQISDPYRVVELLPLAAPSRDEYLIATGDSGVVKVYLLMRLSCLIPPQLLPNMFIIFIFRFNLKFSDEQLAIIESLIDWHGRRRSDSLLTVDAGVHCGHSLILLYVVLVGSGCFARGEVLLEAHGVLPHQGLVGLAQLNFDSGLFVVEAFNFVFHLSLISED